MSDYHEPTNELNEDARNVHRALSSLKEEIEAIDWYHQRVVLCTDAELKSVLAHNRDEEMEHACMTLEWLRRNMAGWNEQLEKYLFRDGPIATEEGEGAERSGTQPKTGDLGIGSLQKGER